MENEYNSKNRVKYSLQVHIIFSTKYRKQMLEPINKSLIEQAHNTAKTARFTIITCETDKDHIHFLISYEPNISISQIVRKLKSETTFHVWQLHGDYMKQYYKKRTLWTPAYFACSVGNASAETIQEYINNQG
jgi:putative transposase